jgi:hypothetical protein
MKCVECSRFLPDTADYCRWCGVAQSIEHKQAYKKKIKVTLVYSTIVTLLLASTVGGWFYWNHIQQLRESERIALEKIKIEEELQKKQKDAKRKEQEELELARNEIKEQLETKFGVLTRTFDIEKIEHQIYFNKAPLVKVNADNVHFGGPFHLLNEELITIISGCGGSGCGDEVSISVYSVKQNESISQVNVVSLGSGGEKYSFACDNEEPEIHADSLLFKCSDSGIVKTIEYRNEKLIEN